MNKDEIKPGVVYWIAGAGPMLCEEHTGKTVAVLDGDRVRSWVFPERVIREVTRLEVENFIVALINKGIVKEGYRPEWPGYEEKAR